MADLIDVKCSKCGLEMDIDRDSDVSRQVWNCPCGWSQYVRGRRCHRGPDKRETVDHPDHYGGADDPFEARKVIRAWGLSFNLGNAAKYICRAGKKGPIEVDLEKAVFYLRDELAILADEAGREPPAVAAVDRRPGDYARIVFLGGKRGGKTSQMISEVVDQANESLREFAADRDQWITEHWIVTRRADRECRRADAAERKIRTLEARLETMVTLKATDLTGKEIAELVQIFSGEPAGAKLEIPWDDLDKAIIPVVKILEQANLMPFASCQGGEGHLARRPFVNLAANPDELDEIAKAAALALIGAGYTGFDVSRVTNHQASVLPWPKFPSMVSIELWELLPGSEYDGATDQAEVKISCVVNGQPVTVETPLERVTLRMSGPEVKEGCDGIHIAVSLSDIRQAALMAMGMDGPFDAYEIRTGDGHILDPDRSASFYDLGPDAPEQIWITKPVGHGG